MSGLNNIGDRIEGTNGNYIGFGNTYDPYPEQGGTRPSPQPYPGNDANDWYNQSQSQQGLIDVSAMASPWGVGKVANIFGSASRALPAGTWAERVAASSGQGLQDAGRRQAMQTGGALVGGTALGAGAGVAGKAVGAIVPEAVTAAKAPVSLATLDGRIASMNGLMNASSPVKTPGIIGAIAKQKTAKVNEILDDLAMNQNVSVLKRDPKTGAYLDEPTAIFGNNPTKTVEAGDINRALDEWSRHPMPQGVNPTKLEELKKLHAVEQEKNLQVRTIQAKAAAKREAAVTSETPVLSPKEINGEIARLKAKRAESAKRMADDVANPYEGMTQADMDMILDATYKPKFDGLQKQLEILQKTGQYGKIKG